MTHNELAIILLGHFAPEERDIPDNETYPGRNASVQAAINGALQEAYTTSSVWLRNSAFGVLLKSPESVEVSVTENSTTVEITGFESWMAGCAIVISGHDVDNRVESSDGTELLIPYGGDTGTQSATIYHTSITVDSSVMTVLKPVKVNNEEIFPIANPEDFGVNVYGDFGNNPRQNLTPRGVRVADTIGKVQGYRVDHHFVSQTAEPEQRMRIVPAPDKACALTYNAKIGVPVVENLFSVDEFPIPHRHVESIIMPMALFRLKNSPWFRSKNTAGINEGYSQALKDLEDLAPQDDNEKRSRPIYG